MRSTVSSLIFFILATVALISVPALLAFKEHLPFSQGFHGLRSSSVAPDFILLNGRRQQVRLSDVSGYRYVYFGFSRCTTVCPSTWAELRRLQASFDNPAVAPKIVFISIDTLFDSPDQMAARFKDFGQNFIPLTGSAEAVRRIAASYHVLMPQNPGEGMHHSGTLYLVDPAGKIALIYPRPTDSKTLLADFNRL